ncbi:Drug/Metabolite Transporter (DMT) Superfamily [Phytophthora cinnamomi]|uniref:Drug/Metabolite Transporter (DMT) Superfamily n=1 Tax=Phytophthora cinnamomi TaxID=4785 RepID=UPI00355A9B02|nr:Drug/Metabolite Transporter (DMT) Superfamily [Phytophthora cinnamomi]
MLTSLSPAHGGAAAVRDAASGGQKIRWSRVAAILEDDTFQGNVSYQQLLAFANNSAVQVQPGVVDPFAAAIEQMPTISADVRPGASSDGLPQHSSRFSTWEAVSMQAMTRPSEAATRNYWKGNNLLPSLSATRSQVSAYAMSRSPQQHAQEALESSKLSKQLMHEWFETTCIPPYRPKRKEWLAQQGGFDAADGVLGLVGVFGSSSAHCRPPTLKETSSVLWTGLFYHGRRRCIFNLSLLTSDFFAVVAAKYLFNEELSSLYFVGFSLIIAGVSVYNRSAPPTTATSCSDTPDGSIEQLLPAAP